MVVANVFVYFKIRFDCFIMFYFITQVLYLFIFLASHKFHWLMVCNADTCSVGIFYAVRHI